MATMFTGSGVAIVTPFYDDYSINYDKLGELVDFHLKNGTDALVVCGTTGEASTLDDHEHIDVIKYVVERTNKRIPVIAGAGSNDSRHGLHLAKMSQQVGADGLLVVTPYYNKTTNKGLIEYFTDYAKAVDLPIMMYNVPGRTGMNIPTSVVEAVSSIENIVALKEASGNISQVAEIINRVDGRIDIYSGNDDQIVPIMALGGKGVVSVVANILPQITHDIAAEYLNGRCDKSLSLQMKYLNLINSLFIEVNPIPIKEAMNLMGLNVGPVRKPLTSMIPSTLEQLKGELLKAGLIH